MARAAPSPLPEPLRRAKSSRTSPFTIRREQTAASQPLTTLGPPEPWRRRLTTDLSIGLSAAAFSLRYVTLYFPNVAADNSADETAPAIVNVNLRNRADVELLHHRRFPIDDVDLAQRNLRIGSGHLLQAWREVFARAAP